MTEDEEEIDEEDASLDDDLLAELDPIEEDEEEDPLTSGFGEVPEEEEKAIEEASEVKEDESEDDTDEDLEEDAEDVDYDTFDDVDEF